MPNPIPASSRQSVSDRDRGLCVRCAGPGADWHHRRGRSVKDEHTHCPCNGVTLCRTCHNWVHANPADAQEKGYIVARHIPDPDSIWVRAWWGWVSLSCTGGATWKG